MRYTTKNMAPDLSEKFLGIDIDDPDDRGRRTEEESDDEQIELAQFLFFELGDQRFAISVDDVRTLADVPDELTRVPRAPPAIEGMMDLRGEITAVIDPRVHFPGIGVSDRSGRERLLVLDRPSDEQSAAFRVDNVIGVEAVPERDVVDETTVDDRPLSGDALAHPLVSALVQLERRAEAETEAGVVSSPSTPDVGLETPEGIDTDDTADGDDADRPALSSTTGTLGTGPDDGIGTTFELEPDESTEPDAAATEEAASDADESDAARGVVVEATPLLDIDSLLLASGQPDGPNNR